MKLLFAFTFVVVLAVVLAESTTEAPAAPIKPGTPGECDALTHSAPDTTDPKRFYQCDGNSKPLKDPTECGEGTEYDKDLGNCGWPK